MTYRPTTNYSKPEKSRLKYALLHNIVHFIRTVNFRMRFVFAQNYIILRRFYAETPQWTPYYRPHDEHPARLRYLQKYATGH